MRPYNGLFTPFIVIFLSASTVEARSIMNIFDEIKQRNLNNAAKTALMIRLKNGTERTYTYAELFDTVSLYQQVLERVRPGDRVAIISESLPEWSIVYLALAGVHATSVLLDASLEARDLLELLEKSDVRCFFASPSVLEKLKDFAPLPPAFNLLQNPQLLLDESPIKLRTANLPGCEDAASIIFSSGTTKKASGILHSHDALLCSTQMCINSTHLKADDRFLAILPNSHIYGLVCQLLGPLLLGAPTCFIDEMTSTALVGAFQNFHPTILPAVPKIYELLKTQILQKINSDEKTKKTFAAVFPICLKLRQTVGLNLGLALFQAVHQNFGGKLR
ncbi:MAG: AMP-binding protein, partial [Evtepia sp.]